MFRWLTKSLRTKGAIFLVALYAGCVFAPPAALAISHGELSAHCISKDRHDADKIHSGNSHLHDGSDALAVDGVSALDEDAPKGKQGKSKICCGMLCISALPVENPPLAPQGAESDAVLIALEQFIFGCGTSRLIRPPIVL